MDNNRTLSIPVILGTARMGRMSLHAARLVTEELSKRDGVDTDLIDIAKLPLPTNDAGEVGVQGVMKLRHVLRLGLLQEHNVRIGATADHTYLTAIGRPAKIGDVLGFEVGDLFSR